MITVYLTQENSQKLRDLAKTLLFPTIGLLLLMTGVIPVEYNPYVLISVFVIILGRVRFLIRKKVWGYADIGWGWKNLTNGWKIYTVLITTGIAFFFVAEHFIKVRSDINFWKLALSAGICAGMQQFLFNWFLHRVLTDIWGKNIACMIVIILFVIAHGFFANPLRVLPASAAFGLVLMPVYKNYPNAPLSWATHGVWNAISIYIFIFSAIWA